MLDNSASCAETQGFPAQESAVLPASQAPAVVGSAGAARAREQSAVDADDGPAPDWVTTDLDVLIPEAAAATSLDNNGQSRTPRQPWNRKQKRIYHRVNSVLTYWEARGYQIRWVMLSSSASSDPQKLAPHHRAVLRRVDRRFGFRDVEWFYVITREGFGVIHAFWAWHAQEAERQRVFWVPQPWLSAQWSLIHGAKVVWIAPYSNGGPSRSRVSRYVTSQYVADQDALVRMGWSWGRTFGIPLARCWQAFKKMHRNVPSVGGMKRLVRNWEAVMRGEELKINGDVYSLDVLRELRAWRRAQLEGGR